MSQHTHNSPSPQVCATRARLLTELLLDLCRPVLAELNPLFNRLSWPKNPSLDRTSFDNTPRAC